MNGEELKKIYLFFLSHKVNRALVNPDYVGILLTKRCNLRCKMCDIRKYPTTPEKELSFKQIKKIVDDVALWGVGTVTLTGGEPFLRKDFFEIAEYTINKVKHTAINTNLTLVDEETADKITELPFHKFHLEVSLDGACGDTHDSIRGIHGAFDKIMQGLRTIQRVSKIKNTNVHIGTTFVLMEENVRELMELVKIASGFNFVNVSIMPALLSNVKLQDRENRPGMSSKGLESLDRVVDELVEYKRKNGLIINPEESLRLYKKYFRGELVSSGMCNAGYMGPNIVEDGSVFICTKHIGNINQNSIKDIWYSAQANKVRRLTEQCVKPCLQHYAVRFSQTNPFTATAAYLKKRMEKIGV